MSKKKTLLSWSSGKDSAWTLYQLQQDDDIELVGLVTTVAGPMFKNQIATSSGDIVERDGFVFADLIPVEVLA